MFAQISMLMMLSSWILWEIDDLCWSNQTDFKKLGFEEMSLNIFMMRNLITFNFKFLNSILIN